MSRATSFYPRRVTFPIQVDVDVLLNREHQSVGVRARLRSIKKSQVLNDDWDSQQHVEEINEGTICPFIIFPLVTSPADLDPNVPREGLTASPSSRIDGHI